MRTVLRTGLAFFVLALIFCPAALSQAYPTNNVIFRVLMVKSQYGRGTIFSIDVDQREYWITAKHILTGAEHPPYGTVDTTKPVSLQILNPNKDEESWMTLMFSVIDPGKDIDIVALAPPHLVIQNAITSPSFADADLTIGGECSFLGFPFGGGWHATFKEGGYWMPYVKHCTVSSVPGNDLLILDGINNHGFSGGPVLYETGAKQKIVGVVSGYVAEPTDIIPSAQRAKRPASVAPKKTKKPGHVDVNSGFIIAYFLEPAVAAIRENPIGPLRPPLAEAK